MLIGRIVVVLVALVVVPAGAAAADDDPRAKIHRGDVISGGYGYQLEVSDPGHPAARKQTKPARRPAQAGSFLPPCWSRAQVTSTGSVRKLAPGRVVPVDCRKPPRLFDQSATWSNAEQCWVANEKQAPRVDPSLGLDVQYDPVYGLAQDRGEPRTCMTLDPMAWRTIYRRAPGAAPAPGQAVAAQAAATVVRRMRLAPVRVGIAPRVQSDFRGEGRIAVVGLPVWFWAERDGAATRPRTVTASLRGMRITATARLEKITWDTGDGRSVICRHPAYGTPMRRGDQGPSPSGCGHTYLRTSIDEPHKAYTVRARSSWVIDWRDGSGRSGRIHDDQLLATAPLMVGEMQALNTVPG